MPADSTLGLSLAGLARSFRRRGFVEVNPRYRHRLALWGLWTPEDFLEHPGEIISGHPDRHVLRVTLGHGANRIDGFMKREHRVPWKDRLRNLRDGFGLASVSCREAATLRLLEEKKLPIPEWIAAGEDRQGRAFLLLKAVDAGVDLRRFLQDRSRRSVGEWHAFARRLGRLVARFHNAGIDYPDLYAKHVLIEPGSQRITFLDWQRSRRPHRLSWRARCRDLAALHASLAPELAPASERKAFLSAYMDASGPDVPPVATMCRRIAKRTQSLLRRSSIRDQRLPVLRSSQPLIWLDGEALCVTPVYDELYGKAELELRAYELPTGVYDLIRVLEFPLRDGRRASLTQRRTRRRLGTMRDWLCGQRWTSPEVRAAADLLRQERRGKAPLLLAFGQRFRAHGVVESFLLQRASDDVALERRDVA